MGDNIDNGLKWLQDVCAAERACVESVGGLKS